MISLYRHLQIITIALILTTFLFAGTVSSVATSDSVQGTTHPPVFNNEFESQSNSDISAENSIESALNRFDYFTETLRLQFEYNMDSVELNGESWDYIELVDGQNMLNSGQAMLPYQFQQITSPYDIIDVYVKFKNPMLAQHLKIAPARPPVPLIPGFESDPNEVIEVDQNYYSTSAFLPREDSEWIKLGGRKVQGEQLWYYSIVLYPFKYNPALGSAELYQEGTVYIKYAAPTQPDITIQDPQSTQSSSTSRSSRNKEPDEVKYAILTDSSLTDEMQVLANWKTQKGVPAKVYDVEDIYDNQSIQGRDDEETLRNFVRWMYNNEDTEYVLLAGDYDKVPPRMTEDPSPYQGIDDGWIPSDLYYACIDEGTTWDKDNDNTFGELGDIDDTIPDIAIGRLAINDGIIMAKKIAEIIEYESTPPAGTWYGRATLVGADVHEYDDGMEQCEYLQDKYLDDVYDYFSKLYDPDNSLDETALKNAINLGSTLLIYLGHGSSYIWTHEKGGTSILFDNSDVAQLSNGIKKPVITTVSCDTSWFDSPHNNPYGDCIGEAYTEKLDKGAIGYLGSVRTTVGWLTQSYYPYAPGLQEDFVRQINLKNYNLGWAYVDGMAHYAQSWGHLFASSSSGEEQACWMEYHLLGEPELTLWVDEPKIFSVTNSTVGDFITVTVKDENKVPVLNARVCIWLEDEVYVYGYTDGSGKVELNVITNSDDEATLTVTKNTYLPYISKVKLLDKIPPVTSYEITPEEPDGMNGWYITPPEINFNVNEQNSLTYYRWDNTVSPIEFSAPFFALEGTHTLHYYSVDSSDNIETEHSIEIKVDTIGPETDMNCTPAEPDGENGWYVSIPKIELIKEPYTTLFYHWDSYPNSIYSSPLQGKVGKHTLYYHARDEAGHIEATKSIEFKVDLDAPKTTINLNPDLPNGNHNWYVSKPTIYFNVEETNHYTIYFYWDNSTQPHLQYNGSFTADLEGEHKLYYYSVDEAGNIEEVKWLEIKIDTIFPYTDISISPAEPTGLDYWYKGSAPVISLVTSESTSKIYYYWDTESSMAIYSEPLTAPEGDHMLYYYSIDTAGNRENVRKVHIKVDTIKPESTNNIYSNEPLSKTGWYLEMPNIELEMDEEGVIYYYILENGRTLDEFNATELELMKQVYYSIYPLEGEYTYYFYAVDKAGNIGDMSEFTIKMDLFDPLPDLKADNKFIMEGGSVLLNAEKSHDENTIISYRFYSNDEPISEWVDSPKLNHTFNKPGTYEVCVKAKDESGRISDDSDPVIISVAEDPEKESSLFMDKYSPLQLILAIIVIIVVIIIVAVLFVYNRKLKKDHEEYDDEDYEEDEYIIPPPPPGMARVGGKYKGDRQFSSKSKRRLRTPPPPPPELPPPPPSVVRIVSRKGGEEFIDDSDIDWDDDSDDDIEWEDDSTSHKMVKLECPRCERRFKTKASYMKSGNKHKISCPHCGARGG
ncbi:MAG: PKD domain-containing protein [Thermoplasmata archaeon]|nr:MAG: PKD domain-containing protein [Thermoplasmata archaeon]